MFWNMTLSTLAAFGATLIVVRLLGKKQISTMTFWDLVSAIALGSLAANIIINKEVPISLSIWVVALWGVLAVLIGWGALKSRRFRAIVQGAPRVIIANGKIVEDELRRERLNVDLLLVNLRNQGVFKVSDVEYALLEPNGQISVLKKAQNQPVTPSDLKLPTGYKGMSHALVLEGEVQDDNLRNVGLTRQWLLSELSARGLAPEEIFYAELATDGSLYVDTTRHLSTRWTQH